MECVQKMEPYYRYWGKAQKDKKLTGDCYHLLPYHSLDVALCGQQLLSDELPWIGRISAHLNCEPARIRRVFCFLLTIHDLGKFSRSFQSLAPNLSDALVPANTDYRYSVRHDSLGFWLVRSDNSPTPNALTQFFAERLALKPRKLALRKTFLHWIKTVTGHHGEPPKEDIQPLKHHFAPEDIESATLFVDWAFDFWLEKGDESLLVDKALTSEVASISWFLVGIAVLADWLGSDQAHFEYQASHQPLEDYAKAKTQNAVLAVQRAGLTRVQISQFNAITDLFPFVQQPTPLQQFATNVALKKEPQLFICEDVTGAGKTEAALVLVHRLLSAGLANGLYVALPTMATANAMYERLAECYKKLFDSEIPPSLVLAYGARHLSDAFRESVAVNHQQPDQNYAQDELSASAYCNAWLADSRKKALLASVGVGTIDQALLAVLPSRHQSLRLIGLTDKVLLVDEAHCYDNYMVTLLKAMISFHAQQGGSVIILSATLPNEMRQDYIAAFQNGAAITNTRLTSAAYPLVTHVGLSDNCADEIAIATRKAVEREVIIQRLDNEEAIQQLIIEKANRGQCVCWIRNTVREAKESYQAMQLCLGDKVSLFHSRFAMCDRQTIEEDVLSRFGKNSGAAQRCGRVLIATQVVEQALDLDFDVLISDLAPVDLLIQRAGRLHRHIRNAEAERDEILTQDAREAPVFYIHSPMPIDDAPEYWLPKTSGSAQVYQDLGMLWRSAKAIFAKPAFRMPDDARALIEFVHNSDTKLDVPQALQDSSLDKEGGDRGDKDHAISNLLRTDKGYTQESNEIGWAEDTKIPTRLSHDTETVVLVVKRDGTWKPYAQSDRYPWDLSQISLGIKDWQAAEAKIPKPIAQELAQLQDAISALKWHKLFPLEGDLATFYCAKAGWKGA